MRGLLGVWMPPSSARSMSAKQNKKSNRDLLQTEKREERERGYSCSSEHTATDKQTTALCSLLMKEVAAAVPVLWLHQKGNCSRFLLFKNKEEEEEEKELID